MLCMISCYCIIRHLWKCCVPYVSIIYFMSAHFIWEYKWVSIKKLPNKVLLLIALSSYSRQLRLCYCTCYYYICVEYYLLLSLEDECGTSVLNDVAVLCIVGDIHSMIDILAEEFVWMDPEHVDTATETCCWTSAVQSGRYWHWSWPIRAHQCTMWPIGKHQHTMRPIGTHQRITWPIRTHQCTMWPIWTQQCTMWPIRACKCTMRPIGALKCPLRQIRTHQCTTWPIRMRYCTTWPVTIHRCARRPIRTRGHGHWRWHFWQSTWNCYERRNVRQCQCCRQSIIVMLWQTNQKMPAFIANNAKFLLRCWPIKHWHSPLRRYFSWMTNLLWWIINLQKLK